MLLTCSLLLLTTKAYCFIFDEKYPIIYQDEMSHNYKDSKFGYSVLLYGGKFENESWIQVGAPEGHNQNYYNFTKPGLVYRCPIKKDCQLVTIDKDVLPDVKRGQNTRSYIAKKDHAWVGATMDLDVNHESVVVCAPRWINKKRDYFIQGACYYSHLHAPNKTVAFLPLVNSNNEIKDNVYNYPMGQAGISAHFSKKNPSQLLIGAPGVYNWKGSPILYSLPANSNNYVSNIFSNVVYNPTVPDISKLKDVYSFAYLCYSVTSGSYFDKNEKAEVNFACGAPRAKSYRGQVLIFSFSQDVVIPISSREGTQIGSYFGSSLTSADINNDGFDDIIVGACHFSKNYDEGRVYVYLGGRNGLSTPEENSVDGNKTNGQFGYAIQNLGDFDGDGCEDIAISAPFENHGVVYIFRGSNKGAPLHFSQRIEAERIYHNLRGFGSAISKSSDVDLNGVLDIAIGAFVSNQAIILRGRPIVSLDMSLSSYATRLDRFTNEFTVSECVWIKKRKNNEKTSLFFIVIETTLEIDKNHNRAFLKSNASSFVLTSVQRVTNVEKVCSNVSIGLRVQQQNRNVLDPIVLFMSQRIIQPSSTNSPILIPFPRNKKILNNLNDEKSSDSLPTRDSFCTTCVIVDKERSRLDTMLEVPFALNCGIDNKCETDLKIEAEFLNLKNNTYILQSFQSVYLNLTISNSLEPAYLTRVEVILPEGVFLTVKLPQCDVDENRVKCEVDNPLEIDSKKSITLDLDMDSIHYENQTKIQFLIMVTSKSDEKNIKDNSIIKELYLVNDARIEIFGKSDQRFLLFNNDIASNATINFEVQKLGHSSLNAFNLTISIPIKYEEYYLIQIKKIMGYQDNQQLLCHWSDSIQIIEEEKIENDNYIDIDEIEEIKNFSSTRTKRQSQHLPLNDDQQSLQSLIFNCSSKNIICANITCHLNPFRKRVKGATLQIHAVFNLNEIRWLKNVDNITLQFESIVQEINGQLMNKTNVEILFVKQPEKKKAETWIIILSTVSGILILLFIVLGLTKMGFFTRKQKLQLEALKQIEVEEEFETNEIDFETKEEESMDNTN